jgi:hypothetical protein
MTKTDRQIATETLIEAFLACRIAEGQAEIDGYTADDSDESSEDSDSDIELREWDEWLPPLSEVLINAAIQLHSTRYLNGWVRIPKSGVQLYLMLHEYKLHHPQIFRSYLQVSPATFDATVDKLRDDAAFQNDSENQQLPVEHQLAVTLYRFGHYGNAASVQKVGLWAGLGYGTVDLFTWRVMTALCRLPFRQMATRWSSQDAKEKAKDWVEAQSCPFWRNGWLMVDGTLVPLFARPGFFR